MDDFQRQIECDENGGDDNDDGTDDDSQIENLFVHTRSGRIAGNWRLSSYIAGEISLYCKKYKVYTSIFELTVLSTISSAKSNLLLFFLATLRCSL